MNAYEWGLARGACHAALKWRKSLGPAATQADAWKLCQRGDWMIWQLYHGLSNDEFEVITPALLRATYKILERVIRRVMESLEGNDTPRVVVWRQWAERWLSGEDRSAVAAWAAGRAAQSATLQGTAVAAWAAAEETADLAVEAAEAAWAGSRGVKAARAMAAGYFREEIPEWPGEVM